VSVYLAWPVLVTLAAGIGTLALISYLFQYRDRPGAKWFILTLAGQSLFCFAYGFGLTVFTEPLRRWLEMLALVGLSWLGVPFLGFALGYTGRGRLLRSRGFKLLLSFPALTTVLLPFNAWHGLVWRDFSIDPVYGVATVSYSFQPLAFLGILGAGTVVAVAAFLLVDTVLSYGPLYRREALAVALSPVPPIAGLFPWLFGFGPAPQLNTIAIGLLPHVLLDAYAFMGSGMFEFYPATSRAAERSTVDDLRSPVVVLESHGRIVDVNAAAESILGLEPESVVTRPVSEVLGTELHPPEGSHPGGSAVADETPDGNSPGTGVSENAGQNRASTRYSVRRDGRRHEFRVEQAPLTDSSGAHVGYTLLFQDITDAIQREERLAVLNRVLRHNLRNDLNVVQGFVAAARNRTDDERVDELLGRVEQKSADLVSVGGTARDIEETIAADTARQVSVDVGEYLTDTARTFEREHPEASITVECDVERVETDPNILDSVLAELVENAIVHDLESPTVTVSATIDGDDLVLRVSDGGPGIPDYEVQTLQDGDETALEHGSGLGLWLVKWGVLRLGGDLTFESSGAGTTATVRLPYDGESAGTEDVSQTSSPSA
jgi:signal transduction histidine kinase